MSNQITAYFKGTTGVAEAVYQNDYGIVMNFDGIYLPSHFDCYFSIMGSDTAIPGVGADNIVAIPNSVLAHEGKVTVHIPLHTGSDDSEVEYVVYFKVIGRARPEDDGTPVQMTAIEKALALLSQPITNIEEIVNEALSFTGETFDEMRSDLQGDYDTFTAGVSDDISDMQEDIAGFKTEIRGDISDVEADFTVLQGQFDTAVAGVTTDTEVTDIRVGADGVTDTTAGASVRRQFTALKSDISYNNCHNVILDGATTNLTHNSCTFTWASDKRSLTAVCTSASHNQSQFNVFYSPSALPSAFKAGHKYSLKYSSTTASGQRCLLDIWIFRNGNTNVNSPDISYNITNDLDFELPSDATGFVMRLRLIKNYTTNETIKIELLNAKTNLQLEADTDDVIDSVIKRGSYNLLKFGEQKTLTHNSTTFTWTDKETCHVVCTASTHSVSQCNFFYSVTSLPSVFEQGKRYYLRYSTTKASGQRCLCDIWVFRNGNTDINNPDMAINVNSNTEFAMPSDATGIVVRLRLSANYTVDETINIALTNAKSNMELADELINTSPHYGLAQYAFSNGTHNGVTYTWNDDKNRCHVSGTASGNSFRNVYYSTTELPLGLHAGDKFGVLYSTTNEHVACRITYQLADGTYACSPYFTESIILTIPSNAVGMFLRLDVVSGYEVDDYVSVPLIFKAQTQSDVIPFKAKKPLMVSFIDDDTSTDDLVTKFYQNCKHNGIVGSFAVCTKQYIDGDSNIAELLSYEYDGFNLIPHCYEQKTYLQPTSEDYDIVKTRENYFQCLRDFITLGIRNPQNLWIIPYGSQDKETSDLAKDLGFDMAFTTLGLANNYLTWNDKFGMHRCGLSPLNEVTDDTSATATGSMAKCKARIDELVASETGGWAIFTTHFNTWQNETWDATLDANGYAKGYARFNELVQYAISQGCEIVSMAQGAAYMKPIIDRNFTMG